MNLKISITYCLLFLTVMLSGQQHTQYSQYMLNEYGFNPAYGGLDFSLSANLLYRSQWDGIEGSPKHIEMNAHLPMYKYSGAVGGRLYRKSAGNLTWSGIAGSYNYVSDFSLGLFSVGARIGMSHLSVDGNGIITPGGIYEGGFSHNDPILEENRDNGIGFSWEIGAAIFNKIYSGGISFSHLPQPSINISQTKIAQSSLITGYFQYRFVVREGIEVLPSILLKSDFIEIQSDISSLIRINGNIFGGILFRGYNSKSIDATAIIFGMGLNENYTLSYSYDFGVSGLRNVHEGSHELLLNYNLRKIIGSGAPPKAIHNPRYL